MPWRRVFCLSLKLIHLRPRELRSPQGECPGPSSSSLRDSPTVVHSIGSPLALSAPSYKAVSSGESISPDVSQSGRGEASGCLYGPGFTCSWGVCGWEEYSE